MVDTRFTHVYCTNCTHFEKLLSSVENNETVCPKPCSTCYPYDFEDSVEHIKRPHYEDLKTKPLWWKGEIMKRFLHKYIIQFIAWYMRNMCGGASHVYEYGEQGRYVVIMNENQYNKFTNL